MNRRGVLGDDRRQPPRPRGREALRGKRGVGSLAPDTLDDQTIGIVERVDAVRGHAARVEHNSRRAILVAAEADLADDV